MLLFLNSSDCRHQHAFKSQDSSELVLSCYILLPLLQQEFTRNLMNLEDKECIVTSSTLLSAELRTPGVESVCLSYIIQIPVGNKKRWSLCHTLNHFFVGAGDTHWIWKKRCQLQNVSVCVHKLLFFILWLNTVNQDSVFLSRYYNYPPLLFSI